MFNGYEPQKNTKKKTEINYYRNFRTNIVLVQINLLSIMFFFIFKCFSFKVKTFTSRIQRKKDILINETKRLEYVEVCSKKWPIDANYWARTLLRGIHSELEPFYLSDDHKERAFCV